MRTLFHAIAAVLIVAAPAAPAQEHKASAVSVTKAWARATPPGAATGAAYMTLTAAGAADRLVAVDSPAAQKAELHTMSMDGGIMRMRPAGAIEVKAGAAIELKPGGLHVMLLGLKNPLEAGASLELRLTFEKAGTMAVSVPVLKLGATGPASGHHGH